MNPGCNKHVATINRYMYLTCENMVKLIVNYQQVTLKTEFEGNFNFTLYSLAHAQPK